MIRLIVGAFVTIGAVLLCSCLILAALCVACAFTPDPLDVWEDE